MQEGILVFISDQFFELVNDPYLKQNKGKGHQRPHYFAFPMRNHPDMYWVIPITSQFKKYDAIIAKRREQKRPTDIFFRTKIRNKISYILLGDMFPVHERYISPYYSYHHIVKVNYKDIPKIHKQAKKVIGLLNKGIKFTDTSPNIPQIIQKQLDYIKSTDSQVKKKFK